MENKKKTSLGQYEQLRRAAAHDHCKPTAEAVRQLLAMMEQELIFDGFSALLCAAVAQYPSQKGLRKARNPYIPKSFSLSPVRSNLTVFDSYLLLSCFAEHISNGELAPRLDKSLPYFCETGNRKPVGATVPCLDDLLGIIDQKIPQCRRELFVSWTQAPEQTEACPEEQADTMPRTERKQHWQAAHKQKSGEILEVQKKLQEISLQIKQVGEQALRIDSYLNQESIRKAYTDLSELYNLIADTRDSQEQLAAETRNEHLENSAFNLGIFLDMISDYLDSYGIRTISTEPGTAFHVTYHALPRKMATADPKSLIVRRSIRSGFAWGDQVLQKEQVEVE